MKKTSIILFPEITDRSCNRLKIIAVLALLIAAPFFTSLALAVELTEPEAAAHAYPALLDLNGKKMPESMILVPFRKKHWISSMKQKYSHGMHSMMSSSKDLVNQTKARTHPGRMVVERAQKRKSVSRICCKFSIENSDGTIP